MTKATKPKVVKATRFLDCPHCGKSIQMEKFRPVNLSDQLLDLLQKSEWALSKLEIGTAFPNYSPVTISNILLAMKKDGLITNGPRGYWSAPSKQEK